LKNQSKQLLITGCVAFLIFPLFSIISLIGIQSGEENPTEVVIIQPKSDSYAQLGGHPSVDSLLAKLLTLSDRERTDQTDLIIWPENAISTSLRLENRYFSRISDSLKVWNTQLITGSGFFDLYEDGDIPQVYRQTQGGEAYNVYNAALFFRPELPTEVYKKGELVPIVERFPFVEFFQKVDYFNWVDWAGLSGYGLGTEANLFDVNGSQTPALICYDSVFPGWVNEFVKDGADFLTIITNDGWWGDSHGHIQHFAFARLRAIEHRMWVARSANNGISGIISPDGKVQHQTEYWVEDAFRFTIYNNTNPTFYSRFGNWIGYLSVILMLFGVVLVNVRRERGTDQRSINLLSDT
jgi:apolipoprotein N-acyltransferase